MPNWMAITVTLCLFADANLPFINDLREHHAKTGEFPAGTELVLFPAPAPADGQAVSNPPASKATTLQPESRLALIRYVAGEFAHALKSLPGGKNGYHLQVGKQPNQEILNHAVATNGATVHAGDSVQITRLEFRDHQIFIDLNGGGRKKHHLHDHLQIGIGGMDPTGPQTTTTGSQGPQEPGAPTTNLPGSGSTIVLEFDKPLPDLTPDDLKQILAPLLDFSKQRSAAVIWIDTLPPEMKKAIQERRPVVGMDRDELIAAIGRPDHKVRERDAEGNDIEDWIYGQPPSKTIFVRFQGDLVTSIKEFPK